MVVVLVAMKPGARRSPWTRASHHAWARAPMKYSLCVRSRRPSQPSPHLLCDTPIDSHTHRSWNCSRVGMWCPNWGSGTPPTDPRGCSRGLQQKGGGIVWFHWYFISFWEYWLTYVCKAFNLSKTPHLLYAQLCLQVCKKSYKRGGSPSEKMWLYVADACLFRGLLCVLQIYKKRSVVVDSALCHHPLSIQHPSVYRKHNNRL